MYKEAIAEWGHALWGESVTVTWYPNLSVTWEGSRQAGYAVVWLGQIWRSDGLADETETYDFGVDEAGTHHVREAQDSRHPVPFPVENTSVDDVADLARFYAAAATLMWWRLYDQHAEGYSLAQYLREFTDSASDSFDDKVAAVATTLVVRSLLDGVS